MNEVKVRWAFENRLDRPYAYPVSIFLEATNYCNYKCPLCPIGANISKRPKGFLDLKTASRAMDEISGFIDGVTLSFYGEPLLHPEISDLVLLAHRRGLHVRMFTNLSRSPERGWQNFVESGVDELVVSIDGLTQVQYSSYRVGGRLERVLSNLDKIIHLRSCHGGKPRLEIQMLALRTNEGEWPKFATRFLDLGVDAVKLKAVNLGPEASDSLAETFLPLNPAFHYYQDNRTSILRSKFHEDGKISGCHELYAGPAIIAWDGRFIACCRDADASFTLGSIQKRTIWDFWNGDEMAELRRRVFAQMDQPSICQQCPALLTSDFTLDRVAKNKHLETNDKSKANSFFPPEPLSSQSILCEPQGTIIESENILLPDGLPSRSFRIREYTPGTLIDYGSYRVFEV